MFKSLSKADDDFIRSCLNPSKRGQRISRLEDRRTVLLLLTLPHALAWGYLVLYLREHTYNLSFLFLLLILLFGYLHSTWEIRILKLTKYLGERQGVSGWTAA